MLLFLLGCSDYDLFGKKDAAAGDDTGGRSGIDDTAWSPAEELCNGVDDDIDGLVDEGYPDDDGDGVVDCLEVDCRALNLAIAGEYPQDDTCAGDAAPIDDPWSYVVEWGFTTTNTDQTSVSAPTVGNLTDDNGDGVVDTRDTPDVVIVGSGSVVLVHDGKTGGLEWSVMGAHGWTTPVVSDSDGDGSTDLLFYNYRGYIARYGGDGRLQATSNEPADDTWNLSVADLDGDGTPEVIAADGIYAGDTLERRAAWDEDFPGAFVTSAVGDVDRDGDQEIFRNGVLYSHEGTPIWDALVPSPTFSFPLLVQADSDDEAELALLTDRYQLFDTDGTLLVEGPDFADWGAGTGPPCAGDFDGDGATELAFPIYYEGPFVMMELDGTTSWSLTTPWRTSDAGCSAFDLDGDGADEVLYAADEAFYVYDGRTGAIRLEYADHTSPTALEYPIVVDIDLDGHAEIVFVSPTGSPYQVTALGHAGEGWPEVGPTWPQHDYAGTQVEDDGHVPATPDAPWLTTGRWRGRVSPELRGDLPNLLVDITDVCVADCTVGSVEVAVAVANDGLADVPAGARVVLQAIDDDGLRDVAEVTLGSVAAGTQLDGITFQLSPSELGMLGFAVSVDPDGGVAECDEADNTDRWEDTYCP